MDASCMTGLIILFVLLIVGVAVFAALGSVPEKASPSEEIRTISETARREMDQVSEAYRKQVWRYLEQERRRRDKDVSESA
jgi:hypothetical protein